MAMTERQVCNLVEEEMLRIADEGIGSALKSYLVDPRPCLLDWDYGHPHPEFTEPRYPGFVVAEFPVPKGNATGIAYSEYGARCSSYSIRRTST
jgi:hypothetical protein